MPSYELTYFDARGRAEVARLLFAAAGVEYKDTRIGEEWKDLKDKTPHGTLPTLKVTDGDNEYTIDQSFVIARFLAKEFGLAGKTPKECATVDQISDLMLDLFNDVPKFLFEKDEEKKKVMEDKLVSETFPKYMKFLDDHLKESKSGYLVGDDFTMADFAAFNTLQFCIFFGGVNSGRARSARFPLVKAFMDKVEAHPKISEYLKNRPDAKF